MPNPPLTDAALLRSQSLEIALELTTGLVSSNPALAAQKANEILQLAPKHPSATLLLGIAQRALGNAVAAVEILQPLVAAQPKWAMAYYELGVALSDMEQRGASLDAMRRAVALNPNIADAWRAIGDQLSENEDGAGADAAYAQHIRASTNDPRLMAAAKALVANEIPEAEARLRKHLKQFPTDVAAMRMLAEVAGRLNRNHEAELLLERCLELAPSFGAARHNYALALYRQNKLADALLQIEHLTKTDSRNAGFRNLKAVILAKIGDYPESIALYADILAKHPAQSKIWMSYGHALSAAGRRQDSIAAYRRSIALTPNFGEAYYSLANLKTFHFGPEEREEMQRRVEDPACTAEDRAHFHFALGKALEDCNEFEASFSHYLAGNEIRSVRVGYNPAETQVHVQRSKQLFTKAFFVERQRCGSAAPDPIFIVGLPRAGSTLIEQILSSHSCVEGTMELPDIMAMATTLGGKGMTGKRSAYPDVLRQFSAAEFLKLGEQYLATTRIQRKSAKPFFIDKMPNNFLHIGFIKTILPNAKIIDARRNPMACCFSGFKQNFAQGQRFTYSLEHIALYYRAYIELMAHFDAVLPGAVHRVIYETMIEDTENQVRQLLNYCELPFEEACLRFYENDRAVRTASAHQVRKPIFRDGVDQWRHYEPWLGPLKETLGKVLDNYPDTPEY